MPSSSFVTPLDTLTDGRHLMRHAGTRERRFILLCSAATLTSSRPCSLQTPTLVPETCMFTFHSAMYNAIAMQDVQSIIMLVAGIREHRCIWHLVNWMSFKRCLMRALMSTPRMSASAVLESSAAEITCIRSSFDTQGPAIGFARGVFDCRKCRCHHCAP